MSKLEKAQEAIILSEFDKLISTGLSNEQAARALILDLNENEWMKVLNTILTRTSKE